MIDLVYKPATEINIVKFGTTEIKIVKFGTAVMCGSHQGLLCAHSKDFIITQGTWSFKITHRDTKESCIIPITNIACWSEVEHGSSGIKSDSKRVVKKKKDA